MPKPNVVVVLSPNFNSKTVPMDLLSDTMYADALAHGVYPFPENGRALSHGIWVKVNPNHAEMNEILALPDVDVVVQTHTIGAISLASSDMFQQDLSEANISDFTREQHQYKRMLAPIQAADNVVLVETAIGTKEAIYKLWEVAKEKLAVFAPEPVTIVEPEVPVVEEPPLDFDNPEEESVAPIIEPEQPLAPVEPEKKPEQVEMQEQSEETFDPLATQHQQPEPEPDEEVEIEVIKHSIENETPLVDENPPVVEDFEKALFDSLAQAESTINQEVQVETPIKKAPAVSYGIPEVYPSVDQTVTFNADKIFLAPKGDGVVADKALHDFGGNIKTFQKLHDILANKLERAVANNRDEDISDFEASIYKYGQDQVSVSDAHHVQYVEGARWANMVQAGPTAVPIIMPIRDPEYGDAKYVGPESVSLIQNRMKTGCKLGVWLPHSGIYFIIVSPGDSQFLDTLAIINNQRIEVLRTSSGILLGNSNYYINRQVLKLFIDSIVHCSLKAWNREQLMRLINERDINIIACALGASIYPDGYDYVQTCGLIKTDKKVCQHQTKKLLDLRRLVFVDNSRLTESQRTFAAGALTERSISEVENYQAANYIGYKKPYEITPGIQFVYRSQSSIVSIEAGEQWIKEIEAVVDSIITFKDDEDTRNLMIQERINLTRIREFSQWIEEILIDDQPLTDRVKINALLSTLSRNKDVVEKVSSTLTEFQRLASVAIVAIPRCKCDDCQSTDTKDLDISTHLIPQDAVSRLFTLVRQRV